VVAALLAAGQVQVLAQRIQQGGAGVEFQADLGVIETGCLKICPKNAVMVVDGNRPKDWLIVEAGTPVGQVAARLGLPRR
jgi:predicted metal-binding protein